MCLWTRYEEKIAHEDIMCYKFVLVNKITGKWCGRFQYNQKEFDFDILLKNNEKRDVKTDYGEDYWCGIFTVVGGGFFHSSQAIADCDVSTFLYDDSKYEEKVVQCTIPKGSRYFTDGCGNYASRKIIVHSKKIY